MNIAEYCISEKMHQKVDPKTRYFSSGDFEKPSFGSFCLPSDLK
jgi:hypothetical protein